LEYVLVCLDCDLGVQCFLSRSPLRSSHSPLLLMLPPLPLATLFPYTTLFRSMGALPELGVLAGFLGYSLVRQMTERTTLPGGRVDRKSTRLNSSHQIISYAVFCLKKKRTCITLRYPTRC